MKLQIGTKLAKVVKLYLLILLALIVPLASLGSIIAQSSITLTISPPLFELTANPGDVLKNSIRLENPTDDDRKVTIDLRNFTALGEEGAVNLTPEETAFSLASWIKIGPTETTLPARSQKTFDFTITVPPNAEPGGHFGSIVFKTAIDKAAPRDQSGAQIIQQLGALLLVKVSGAIVEEASIASFSATKDLWEKPPVTFETRIANSGNVHFKPRGNITITNLFGQEVGKISLEERNVLPRSTRKLTNQWDPDRFTFGRYSANLSAVYGRDDKLLNNSVNFWVIPYKLVAAMLVIILGIGILSYHYRKRLKAALKVLAGRHH